MAQADWSGFLQLLRDVHATEQPPALLLLWSSYLPDDAWATKHYLVCQVQQAFPSEPVTSRFANAATSDILAWTFCEMDEQTKGRAVELATHAVRLAPRDGDFWNTLGVAHYRAGHWTEAVAALEKARELSNGGDAVDRLFLAMAHWQLGEREEARRWYDQAVQKPETSKLLRAKIPLYRTEAARLLGLEH
jgi:tetratricopeptide (TPR) repeat protein